MPRILVMDDDEQSLDLFRTVFTVNQNKFRDISGGENDDVSLKADSESDCDMFDVIYCSRSLDAVNHVRESMARGNPFAAAFLDICMEGQEDGIWVGQKLRELDPHMELVFVTGYSGYNPNEIAKLVPPVHKMIYVQKPYGVYEMLHLAHALADKWKNEKKDREMREKLHEMVAEKTVELKRVNEELEKKVKRRTEHLEETNTALKVLLRQREEDKKRIGDTFLGNVQQLVKPMVEKLKMTNVSTRQANILKALESNLEEITSPFLNSLDTKYFKLTPMEMQVANHVKSGLSNKEIAELLGVSEGTVTIHRHNLRKKLGILKKKINLRTHLLSLAD